MERSERNSSTSSSPRGPPANAPRLDISRVVAKAVCPGHTGVRRSSKKISSMFHLLSFSCVKILYIAQLIHLFSEFIDGSWSKLCCLRCNSRHPTRLPGPGPWRPTRTIKYRLCFNFSFVRECGVLAFECREILVSIYTRINKYHINPYKHKKLDLALHKWECRKPLK